MEPTASYERSPSKTYRKIELNHGKPAYEFADQNNYVSTCKYEWYTILPKNLFEQFHRVANLWFLLVSVLQLLPFQLSPTSSWATIIPLSIVLAFTLLKDAYQDYKRRLHDNEINNAMISKWNDDSKAFEKCKLMDLVVGNYIKLSEGNLIPADIVVLASSDEDAVCYLETSNLDGESNLKTKSAIVSSTKFLKSEETNELLGEKLRAMHGYLKCENPNNRLHNFDGLLKLNNMSDEIPLDINNLLLRGCSLKNTDWILGVVIFVGLETKIMMNRQIPHHKRSKVERKLNKYLIFVFSLLFLITIMCSIISVAYSSSYPDSIEYFSGQDNKLSILNFITFLILYNSFVPISLYITMDLVKIIQSKFIQWDLRMYDPDTDRCAISKTGDLNEDLGQIEYLFSDKTGTLTENVMRFKKCSIKGRIYTSAKETSTSTLSGNFLQNFTFCDESLVTDGKQRCSEVSEFFEAMALCHTVSFKRSDEDEVVYISTSPDEQALVQAAHTFGYTFKGCKDGIYSLEVNGDIERYQVIGINDFSSNRKRMSIVLRRMSQDGAGQGILLCKGADDVMLKRSVYQISEQDTLEKNLTEFASEGLRTLVICKRNLTYKELVEYEALYISAKSAISGRTTRLEALAEKYEKDMDILGVTGIEDKIQHQVPETILKLTRAGIKVWVLTGDKQETAINIGYSTNLLSNEMDLVIINCKSVDEAKQKLSQAISLHIYNLDLKEDDNFLRRIRYVTKESINMPDTISHYLKYVDERFNDDLLNSPIDIENLSLALIIDGDSLNFIFSNTQTMKLFAILSFLCNAVICCRVSPLQKAEVVKLVKNHYDFKPVTLAIGDGANDVSMIQQAHVGVGIFGKEGLQAANSSDYAIARFKNLIPLLFLHGRWNYHRISRVVLYSFYKNFLLVLPMFYYFFLNQYSGTSIYDSWLIMSYNTIFTSLPVVVLGCMDKDISPKLIISNPRLYTEGILSKVLNMRVFIEWTIVSIIHSVILYTLIVITSQNIIKDQGGTEDLVSTGTVLFISIVHTATYTIMLEMRDWNIIFCTVTSFSIVLMYPLLFFYDFIGFPSRNLEGIASRLFTTVPYLFSILFTPMICFIVHYVSKCIKFICYPSEHQKLIDTMIKPKILRYKDSFSKVKLTKPDRLVEYANKIFKVFDPRRINKGEDEDLSFKKYTLEFNSSLLESSYMVYTVEQIIRFTRIVLVMIFLANLVWTLQDVIFSMESSLIIGVRITVVASFGLTILFIRTDCYKNHYHLSSLILIILAFAVKFTLDTIKKSDSSMSQAISQIVTFILFNLNTYRVVGINIVFNILYIIRIGYTFSENLSTINFSMLFLEYSVLIIAISLTSAIVSYRSERSRRRDFVKIRELEYEYQKGRYLLDNLLPGFVQPTVSQGIRYISKERMNVTILYCEICDFDSIYNSYSSYKLIELLDSIYTIVDSICEQFGVTKIETVNNSYTICSGLKDIEPSLSPEILARNHAERGIQVALEILKRLNGAFLNSGDKLTIRIGIHSGPVIAGVVGDHKPQFTLFGDTVSIAHFLCRNTEVDEKIRISSATYLLVKHLNINYIYDEIKIEGKGNFDTFLIEDSSENHKNMFNTSFDSMDQQSYFLAQSHQREDLNSSVLPLINKDSLYSIDTESKNNAASKTCLENLEFYLGDNDDENVGIADPVQWLVCRMKETKYQSIYRIKNMEANMTGIKLGLVISIIVYSILTTNHIITYKLSGDYGVLIQVIMRGTMILGIVVLSIVLRKIYKHYTFPWGVMMIFIAIDFIITTSLYTLSDFLNHSIILEKMYTNIIISYLSGLSFGHTLIASIFQFMNYIVILAIQRKDFKSSLEKSCFLLGFILLNLAFSYTKESRERHSYNVNISARKEIHNTEKLLYQIIPPYAARNLKSDFMIREQIYETSILNADIPGLKAWSEDKAPIEVIGLLSTIFSKFDRLCIKNNVYKVHNIGDCYIVTSLSEAEDESKEISLGQECIRLINMSLRMIEAVNKISRENKLDLGVRIGLHTGRVIGGITRSNIVRYDIYGPEVEFTHQIQRASQPGKINLSESTKNLIEQLNLGKFEFITNKTIHHETSGMELESYYLRV
jgi:phospholipid-transporting ATPase